MITKNTKKKKISNNKTHSSVRKFFFFCCIGHGLISAHLSAILVGNFLNLFFILFADYSIFEQKINKVTFFVKKPKFLLNISRRAVRILLLYTRMGDKHINSSDVLVLGACIMDFIWFVLPSFNHYNHPRCHLINK